MAMFIPFFLFVSLGLTIKLNFNISKVVHCHGCYALRHNGEANLRAITLPFPDKKAEHHGGQKKTKENWGVEESAFAYGIFMRHYSQTKLRAITLPPQL